MNQTIIGSMIEHAGSKPDEIAFRYLTDLDQAPQELSFKGLWQDAQAIASYLSRIAEVGDRIMLFFPPGLAYVKAFYGCLIAGMVAVPLYPPRRNVKSDRIMKVAQSCQSTVALTTLSELTVVKGTWDEQNAINLPLNFHTTDHISYQDADLAELPQVDPAAAAFLQYTSGSTGTPKGVVITHANIIGNVRHLSLMSSGNPDDVFVNWLPLFHDLGLITAVLWPVYLGAPSNLMAPATFVREPVLWLKAISRYRGSMCGSPNFAYDLCSAKVAEADLAGLDLSSWRVAYNAAEPVRADTLDNFVARFGPCGFRAEAFYPGFGMAEATVFITGGEARLKPTILSVNKVALAAGQLELMDASDPLATRIVSCGTASEPHQVRVVDPDSACSLPEGRVGEIWFSGPSVSPGYWQLDELNAVTFHQNIVGETRSPGFLRTGDLGVMWQGELYVAGRIKDLIIVRGRNYYPQDIEASAGLAHKAIRQAAVAAFSVTEGGHEHLVVVAEIERECFRSMNADEVISAIRQQVMLDFDVSVDRVVLLKPYKIPLTSSGKIQRKQTREMLQSGELDVLAQSDIHAKKTQIDPVSPTEIKLHAIWLEVLQLEQISIADNFFEMGGDSVAAIEMAAALKKEFGGLELDTEQLQAFPTISLMAGFLDLRAARTNASAPVPTSTVSKNKLTRI
jgi:acyl-CoA synthetase (AMP-forming)/AMP-acid ligase II/acyl carrier protein